MKGCVSNVLLEIEANSNILEIISYNYMNKD